MIRNSILLLSSLFLLVSANAQRAVCPADTLRYNIEKATNVDTLVLNTAVTQGIYQYFECPQEIEVSGARFYGFKPDTAGGSNLTITVELRKIANDSVPGTNLLASASMTLGIPDSFNGPLEQYGHELTWTPVTVDEPYAIVVRADSNGADFALLHSDLDALPAPDGAQEWLAGAYQSGWIRSYIFNPTGVAFDADFFIEPFVDYNLNASFINDPECLFDELGDTVYFFNDGAAIVDSRMYNRFAFYGFPDRQYWNYGDGVQQYYPNPQHFYPTNGPYAATLTAKILSWTNQACESTVTQIIKEKPAQDFSYITSNLEVDFTNETFGLFTNIEYDFGDGNTSTSEDPTHKYAEPGTYWVCQTMTTSCGEVKHCENVAVATNTALNCGKDSVRYTSARGTDIRTIDLKNPNSGQRLLGVGQRFDIPQSMIIHGFTFYANHDGLFKDSYPVECKIWRRGNDNLPSGNALATSTVYINKHEVDTNYSDTVRYTAIFNKPVNVKQDSDVIFTIEYDSNAVDVQISTNDWEEGDGDQDLLAIGKINDTTWVTAASVAVFNCGGVGVACDCDIIIEPLIEFNIDANFEYPFPCLVFDEDGKKSVQFTDLSSPIVRHRIYNQIAFYGSSVIAYEWDFGDSTGISNQINAVHTFLEPGPFDVELTITVEGWTTFCENTQVLNVPVAPTGGWGYEQITSQINLVDSSHNADEYLWTFSDSTISTLSDPVHYFTSLGRFEICQYVSNVCGSDTICDSVTINVLGVPENIIENIQVYPNPANDNIHINTDLASGTNIQFTLIEMSGRVVRRLSAEPVSQNTWYVGDLARGTYILRMESGDFVGTKPFILTR